MRVTDFQSALAFLAKGRNKDSRTIENNTRIVRRGDKVAVQLHSTDVLTWAPDGTVSLDVGQWRTVTSKARLNEYLPAGWHIWQTKNVWYLVKGHDENRLEYVYQNGIVIAQDGTVSGAGKPDDIKAQSKLRKRVKAYAKAFVDAIAAGQVKAPGLGDCMFCHMQTDTGESMGEAFRDKRHILCHLDENYFVPSLLYRAIEDFPVSQVAKWFIAGETLGAIQDVAKEQVAKSIFRYIMRQLA